METKPEAPDFSEAPTDLERAMARAGIIVLSGVKRVQQLGVVEPKVAADLVHTFAMVTCQTLDVISRENEWRTRRDEVQARREECRGN